MNFFASQTLVEFLTRLPPRSLGLRLTSGKTEHCTSLCLCCLPEEFLTRSPPRSLGLRLTSGKTGHCTSVYALKDALPHRDYDC